MAARPTLPLLAPMLATLGPLAHGTDWAFEHKWDGVRAIVAVESGRVRVGSRNQRDVTASYPELTRLGELLARRRVLLDGEIVSLGPNGAPSFELLQLRMHVKAPTPALIERVPVRLQVFDVLHLDRKSTMDQPYSRRRELLDGLGLDFDGVRTPGYWIDAGDEVMASARELGLEGVVAKRLTSTYQPGRRSPAWVKTPLNNTIEVVIAGWRPGAGRREGMIGSLLLAAHDTAGGLVYIGQVGTGFTDAALRELDRQLRSLTRDTSPYTVDIPRSVGRDARWVRPELVGEVEFRSWTGDHRLRHPAWRGLRPDRSPAEVRLPG